MEVGNSSKPTMDSNLTAKDPPVIPEKALFNRNALTQP